MRELRIAHVFSWYVPGLGYEENYLPFAQEEEGHEVALFTSKALPGVLRLSRPDQADTIGFDDHKSEGRERAVLVRRLRSSPEIRGQIVLLGLGESLRRFRPDVVHVHGSTAPMSVQCLLLQRRLGSDFSLTIIPMGTISMREGLRQTGTFGL